MRSPCKAATTGARSGSTPPHSPRSSPCCSACCSRTRSSRTKRRPRALPHAHRRPTMAKRRYNTVDVFTAKPLLGNPLAVVHDGTGLSDATMLKFTQWTNLSETTFLLPPTDLGADYRVRIFFPGGELPFAGHPTLGTCHAWLAAGGKPKNPAEIVQQCGVGLVRVRRDGSRLAFAAPPLKRSGPVDNATLDSIARSLRIARGAIRDSQWVSNGPG